jgi:hypothetical protein
LNYSPVDDAYKQGASYFNDNVLKVEPGYRISYLKFNIADIPDGYAVTNASLQLTENGDVGNGTLRFYRGSGNNWTETTLNASNEPATQDQVGIRTGGVTGGQTVIVNITPLVTANGIYSLIVMMDSNMLMPSIGHTDSVNILDLERYRKAPLTEPNWHRFQSIDTLKDFLKQPF